MSELKLCVNCKHYSYVFGNTWCERYTQVIGTDPVDGTPKTYDPCLNCRYERKGGLGALLGLRCGPKGKFFEERGQ